MHRHSIQISRALRRQRKLKFPPKIENHVMLHAGDTTARRKLEP